MLGTWQPTRTTARRPTARRRRATRGRTGASDPQAPDRRPQSAADRARSWSRRLQHASHAIIDCASTQVAASPPRPGALQPGGQPFPAASRGLRYCGDARPHRPPRANPGRPRARRRRGSTGRRCLTSTTGADIVARTSGVAAGRRAPPRQGRAPPEDGLVQAARDDRTGGRARRRPAARAGSSRCPPGTPVRPTPGPAREAACRRSWSCRPAPSARRSTRAIGYGAEVVLQGEHVGESLGAAGARSATSAA